METQTYVNVLKNISEIINLNNDNARKNKENFNILECLTRFHLEELHSKLLGYLLNPLSDHDCGDVFLRLFLDELELPDIVGDLEPKIVLEKFIGRKDVNKEMYGFIDLYIETDKNIIVIENKLTAKDQEDQLMRYNKYCECMNGKDSKLFYLTIWGSKSPEAEKYNGQIKYQPISYRTTILSWLEKCMESAEISPYKNVVAGIKSYYDILKQRILHLPNMNAINETSDILLKSENREILANIDSINATFKEARNRALKEFWLLVETAVKERLDDNWLIDFHKSYSIDERHGHLALHHKDRDYLDVCFQPLYCHLEHHTNECLLALWQNQDIDNKEVLEHIIPKELHDGDWFIKSKPIGKNEKMYVDGKIRDDYAKELAIEMLEFAKANLVGFSYKVEA